MDVPYSDLLQGEAGLYRTGRFYSLSFSGNPHEWDIIGPSGVGRDDHDSTHFGRTLGGVQKTTRIVVLLHETAHYVHDLSLGACMASDYALDQSSAILRALLQKAVQNGVAIRAPLLVSNAENLPPEEPELRQLVESLKGQEAKVTALWDRPAELENFLSRFSRWLGRSTTLVEQLSGLSLVEGLVATKTLIALCDRIASEEDAAYLERIHGSIQVVPELLPPLYNLAQRVFDETVGALTGAPSTRLSFRDYGNSERFVRDQGLVYLLDIALHIPPFAASAELIRTARHRPEHFNPTLRFCMALISIIRHGGFPPINPALGQERYYVTVFDAVAADWNWPTFAETNDAWKLFLSFMKGARREAADGYRCRMLIEREKHPYPVVLCDALLACWRQHVPVFHMTPRGFKTLMMVRGSRSWYRMPHERPDMAPWETFHSDRELWNDLPAEASLQDLEADHSNSSLLQQEIVYRSLCVELRASILYKKSFSCPFAPHGCASDGKPCTALNDLDCLPHHGCCAREYLKQEGITSIRIEWGH